VPAHLMWFRGGAGGDRDDRGDWALGAPEEREGTTDLSKLNRNEAARTRRTRWRRERQWST